VEQADLDELTFEPSAWDLAMSIGIGVDPESDRAALDELADAMLVWSEEEKLDELTDRALGCLWGEELEAMIREGLAGVRGDPEWLRAAANARLALDEHAAKSEIAREVVRHLAMQLGQADQPLFACLCCIDEGLELLEPSARRERARRAAVLARRNAEVSDAELQVALRESATTDPVAALGTPERRHAVRRRLGRLGQLGSTSMPALAAELTRIGSEPLPSAAGDDDVWAELCTWMLAEAAMPELN